MSKFVSIANAFTESNDIKVDLVVDIGTKIVFGSDDKKLGETSIKRENQVKTFVTKKSVKVGKTVVQMSPDQLN